MHQIKSAAPVREQRHGQVSVSQHSTCIIPALQISTCTIRTPLIHHLKEHPSHSAKTNTRVALLHRGCVIR
jgi:hypothetical protein